MLSQRVDVEVTGTRANVKLGLTWRNDRVTCGRGKDAWLVWRMTRCGGGQNLQAVRAVLDGGDFCAAEFDWAHRNSDGDNGAIPEMTEAAEECLERRRTARNA
uniref:Uncharacterized protein n=1 Tax=Fagus sylvatica TaxID=28930 RepID=A0A2N9HNJ4_FAGSY